jgi:hypothetical protein
VKEGQDVTDSTPRRIRRGRPRASGHGDLTEQLRLSVDEREPSARLFAAITAAFSDYERQSIEPGRAVRR